MSNYNSENTTILATHKAAGGNTRMLLLHRCGNGRLEYVIGSYFEQRFYDGFLGYERMDYSWYHGHYFSEPIEAIEYWKEEVLGEGR